MEQIVNKIEQLYSTDPANVVEIQKELQQIQRSEDAYELAMLLIQLPSKNCKFFGASTFGVFINQHNQLTGKEVAEIEDVWVEILAHLMAEEPRQNSIVIRKMLSNLLVLFFKYYEVIHNPMWKILEKIGGSRSLQPLISSLSVEQLILIATFYSSMAEEAVKRELTSRIHTVIKGELFPDFETLIKYSDQNLSHNTDYEILVLDTINSWISYISFAEGKSDVRYNEDIEFVFDYLSKRLLVSNPGDITDDYWEIVKRTMYILSEAVELSTRLITRKRKDRLFNILVNQLGPSVLNYVFKTQAHEELSDVVESYANLIITSATYDLENLLKKILHPEIQNLWNILLKLTDYPGHPVIEEQISTQLIIFWQELASLFAMNGDEYAEYFKESYGEVSQMKNELFRAVCKIYWRKCQLPAMEDYFANRTDISHYRNEIADMFIEIYPSMEETLYGELTGSVIGVSKRTSIDTDSILSLESSLFLLYKITDVLSFYDSVSLQLQETLINELFSNGLITFMRGVPRSPFFVVLFSSLINFLHSIQFYYKKEPVSIPPVLDLLFNVIFEEKKIRAEQEQKFGAFEGPSDLTLLASKAISKICNESSSNLVSIIPDLSTLLIQSLQDIKVDSLVRERLCNSLISIARSTKEPEQLSRILSFTLAEIFTISQKAMASDFNEHIERYLISLLECVYQMGCGCELPEEMEEYLTEQQQFAIDQFWNRDPDGIRDVILKLVALYTLKFQPFTENSIVTKKCFSILNVGLRDPIGGPFHFSNDVLFDLSALKVERCDNASIAYVHKSIARTILINHKDLSKTSIDDVINKVVVNKIGIIQADSDLISSSNELFTAILDKRPSLILFSHSFQQNLVNFFYLGLNSKQNSNIKTASKFWTSLLTLKRGKREDHQLLQDLIITQNLGRLLTENLTKSFINAFRATLDWYYPIFRALLSKYTLQFKAWFKDVMIDLDVKQLDEITINSFVSQLVLTRGHREANGILMKIWLTCNGSIDFKSKNLND